MEKLDKVIAGLTACIGSDCGNCEYILDRCESRLLSDALEVIENQNRKLDILRAELAEERERSARWVRESEPVVHAHWNGDCCSACDELAEENYPRCPHCGAHMDEEVADNEV